MSGAEAWAAVGLAANVLQIIGFAGDVAGRLKWIFDEGSDAHNAPKVVKEVQDSLPTLEGILVNMGIQIKAMAPVNETGGAFFERYAPVRRLVLSCETDMKQLAFLLLKVVPAEDAGTRERLSAVFTGITMDKKLVALLDRLKGHLDLINKHQESVFREWITTQVKGLGPGIEEKIDQLTQAFLKQSRHVTAPLKKLNDLVIQVAEDQNQNIEQNQAVLLETLHSMFIFLQRNAEAGLRPVEPIDEVRKPVNNIPALGVKDFVPRRALSEKIANLLSPAVAKNTSGAPTVVLKGMGGQGKTQLAIAYCKEALESTPKTFHSVFWVDATSEASVLRSYEEIAEKLTNPAPKFESDRERKDFVETRLKAWELPWLMVFDNYDEPQAFKSIAGIRKFMPECMSSHFLITSRHTAATRLCSHNFVVDVEGMAEDEAIDLFCMRSGVDQSNESRQEVAKIVDRLGKHPLAIDLIGTYFKSRGLPLDQILQDYNSRAAEILRRKSPAWHEYRKRLREIDENEETTAVNVFTSIEMSYQQLVREEEKSHVEVYKDMLALLAFLHDQLLSEKIFFAEAARRTSKSREWLKFFVGRKGDWSHERFVDMLVALKDKLLISNFTLKPGSPITSGITFHPLVKDWIKMRLTEEEQSDFAVEATHIVERFLSTRQNEVATFNMIQEEKREALSYVIACQDNIAQYCHIDGDDEAPHLGQGELADAGQIFALFLEFMGKIDEAQKIFETLIDWQERTSDKNDLKLLTTKSLYTEILRSQKNFRKAEEYDREVYDARLKILGPEHVDVLWSAHDLGWDLEALGDVEKAEVLQRKAYGGRKKVLGQSHASTLQSINNLAHTLRRQGKTLEALEKMRETLRIGREVFQVPHHSEIIQFLSNLQDILRFQGLLDEAEAMARESLKATCAEWGIDHPKAAASRGQLKDILWDRNEAEKAEEVAKDNLDIMQKSPYSTDISRIDDIALLLGTLSGRQMTGGVSRKGEIEQYANRAIELVKGLPEDTLKLPSTLQDLIYLATGLEVLRESKQLIELEPIIFEHCKEVFDISDRNTVNSLVRLSSALRVEGEGIRADKYCQDAINLLRAKLDTGDQGMPKSTHLAALSWLAVLYKHMGKQREAMEVYDRAFDYVSREDFVATADYETLYSIQGLAEDIDDQRRCQKAEILHRAVLQTRRDRYGSHPCVDDSLYAYSWNLRLQDRLNEAEMICLEALKIAREFRGPHRNTMCILKRLAYLEEQLGKHEMAERHYREVLNGFRALGTRHITRVTEALEDLQELLMEQRKWEEARALIQDAMKRREEGWDRNMGHYAGLIRHLAIVTWEIGNGVEGLRLYRKARRAYEEAWGLHQMKEGHQKQNLIRRINELLPGTENMEEEMRIEEEQRQEAAQEANDTAAQKNADPDALDDGQKTPTAVQDVKAALQDIHQQRGPSRAGWDGATQTIQVSTKDNQEATVENGGQSLSRQTTLGANSLPEAPSHEPSKMNETSATLDEVTRQMGQANLGQ